jgi:hypothetical protein
MARRSKTSQKKRAPSATAKGEPLLVRFHARLIKQLEKWAGGQADTPSRPEAIRRLVEIGLSSAPSQPRTRGRQAASKMAARAIDDMSDGSVSDSEQAKRKRRLLKGPKEFREMRGDQPKRGPK